MANYKAGDRIKVTATGQLGTVSMDSFSAKHSVGDKEALDTDAVLAKLDGGGDFEKTLIHDEIEKEKADEKKAKHEHVQPEPEHRGKSSVHKR